VDAEDYFLMDEETVLPSKSELRSLVPHDVDKCFLNSLPAGEVYDRVRDRLYDIFSWQSFLAVNWPVDNDGKALPKFTDLTPGAPRWVTWKERQEVFREDGSEPKQPEGGPFSRLLPILRINSQGLTSLFNFADVDPLLKDKRQRLLVYLSATDDVTQFSAKPAVEAPCEQPSRKTLWDQNGNVVYYETLLNDQAFQDIVERGLYNKEKQKKFYTDNHPPGTNVLLTEVFQKGDYKVRTNPGAVMLKLAWRVLDQDKDDRSRFYVRTAYLPGLASKCHPPKTYDEVRKIEVGLVGMHIIHKTLTSPNWVWSTFEHVDNLTKEGGVKPLFYNRACRRNCRENKEPETVRSGRQRGTQVQRVLKLPTEETQKLNSQMKTLLEQKGSVWRYYRLVGTQYRVGLSPESKPKPDKLTNPVLETYTQDDSCLGCHEHAPICKKENGESSPACKAGTGDFVFLLRKAH